MDSTHVAVVDGRWVHVPCASSAFALAVIATAFTRSPIAWGACELVAMRSLIGWPLTAFVVFWLTCFDVSRNRFGCLRPVVACRQDEQLTTPAESRS
jgi:hypothetical protein